MTRIYAVKCLLKDDFSPAYESHSSFEEVTVLVAEDTISVEKLEATIAFLRPYLEDSYVNAEGRQLTSRLFHIAGVQELDDPIQTARPVTEIYRWFYSFDRLVTEEEFLQSYYFDDLGPAK